MSRVSHDSYYATNARRLALWCQMTHICVSDLGHHCFACLELRYYMNQGGLIINWTIRNIRQWKFDRNSSIFIWWNTFENAVCKTVAILYRLQCVKLVYILFWKVSWVQWLVLCVRVHRLPCRSTNIFITKILSALCSMFPSGIYS